MSDRPFDPNDPDPVVGILPGAGPPSDRLIRRSQVSPELAAELEAERVRIPDFVPADLGSDDA